MKAELVPANGDPPIRIVKDVTIVGRREFCDVQVDDPTLSKRHCILVKTDGLLILRDLATTNGTKVNGQRVRWAALLPNDKVTFGGYKVRVYMGSDGAASPSESFAKRALSASAPAAPTVQEPLGFSEPSPLSVPIVTVQAPAAERGVGPVSSGELPWPKLVEVDEGPGEHEEIPLELDEEPLVVDPDDLF